MNRSSLSLIISMAICLPMTSAGSVDANSIPEQPSLAAQLTGNWQSLHLGRQTLTTNIDGTAKLHMRLSPMAAVLYGKELTLDLKWSLEGDRLTQVVTGGTPESRVRKLTSKFGETYTYRVVEASADRLIVEDATSGKTSTWTAVETASSSVAR